MAMLAEPRQRKRYNLVPRGKALYEDDSRFGTKMLEKMGWSKGKGLGPKEEGALDFIRVRYKNDAEGFGYEQRDDQWIQHEDGFNGLLKSLNGEEDSNNRDDSNKILEESNEDDIPRLGFGFQDASLKGDGKKKSDKPLKLKEKISGISLEEKSKQSRARVHYKKFTRGKDLSQYSEKDLANIFGKKIEDEQQLAVNDFYQQLNNTFNKQTDSNENLNGVQIISTGVSVSDYFKKKMEAMKNRRNGHKNLEDKLEQEISTEIPQEETSKKKKAKKEKIVKELQKGNEKNMEKEDSCSMFDSGVSVADYFKNKMEEMKKRKMDNNNTENIKQDISIEIQEDIVRKKKKNKKEIKDRDEHNEMDIIEGEQSTNKIKKSKKPNTVKVDESPNEEIELLLANEKEELKKTEDIVVDNISEEKPQKKKRRYETNYPQEFVTEKNKKKKNKTKNPLEVMEEDQPNLADSPMEFLPETDLTQEPEIKKKKNKTIDPLVAIELKASAQKIETMPEDQPNDANNSVEFMHEIDLTQEPEKKKKKKNKTKDSLEDIKETYTPQEIQTLPRNQPSLADSPLEFPPKIDLTQEPEKKKKKKSKNIDTDTLEETNVKETPRDQTNTSEKNKKSKQESRRKQECLSNNQINESISTDVKKLQKSKSKRVSATTKQEDLKSLTLDDLKNAYNSFNIYKISSFCAEKFRNINLNQFPGSTLPQVDGYAINKDIKLDVTVIKNDEERITNLWKNTLDKYGQLEKPKKTYTHYIKDVIKARKAKQKRPKLYVKTWKRKNAFQAI